MPLVTVRKRRQITIPASLGEDIQDGTQLEITRQRDGSILMKPMKVVPAVPTNYSQKDMQTLRELAREAKNGRNLEGPLEVEELIARLHGKTDSPRK